MKTIIIPTDFSPASTCAMNYGVDMAKQVGASVLLFHVYNVPVSMTDVPVLLVSTQELKKEAEAKINSMKAKVEHITSGAVKIYAEAKLGDVIDELETVCNKIKPFAVVMGSKGHSAAERVFFGSTTLSAIRQLTFPVIAVPTGKEYGTGIKKIGFACDFRDVVETTPADEINDIVKTFDAELHVLNVDHNHRHFKAETPEQSMLLDTMLEGCKPTYDFIDHEDIEDGINAFAETNNLDLVIAIPKKHKLVEKLFNASSTKQLIFQSHIPVMCIHEE
ncbi:MAG TPA: universal stress protein [Chitinophagaceae bacterium]